MGHEFALDHSRRRTMSRGMTWWVNMRQSMAMVHAGKYVMHLHLAGRHAVNECVVVVWARVRELVRAWMYGSVHGIRDSTMIVCGPLMLMFARRYSN